MKKIYLFILIISVISVRTFYLYEANNYKLNGDYLKELRKNYTYKKSYKIKSSYSITDHLFSKIKSKKAFISGFLNAESNKLLLQSNLFAKDIHCLESDNSEFDELRNRLFELKFGNTMKALKYKSISQSISTERNIYYLDSRIHPEYALGKPGLYNKRYLKSPTYFVPETENYLYEVKLHKFYKQYSSLKYRDDQTNYIMLIDNMIYNELIKITLEYFYLRNYTPNFKFNNFKLIYGMQTYLNNSLSMLAFEYIMSKQLNQTCFMRYEMETQSSLNISNSIRKYTGVKVRIYEDAVALITMYSGFIFQIIMLFTPLYYIIYQYNLIETPNNIDRYKLLNDLSYGMIITLIFYIIIKYQMMLYSIVFGIRYNRLFKLGSLYPSNTDSIVIEESYGVKYNNESKVGTANNIREHFYNKVPFPESIGLQTVYSLYLNLLIGRIGGYLINLYFFFWGIEITMPIIFRNFMYLSDRLRRIFSGNFRTENIESKDLQFYRLDNNVVLDYNKSNFKQVEGLMNLNQNNTPTPSPLLSRKEITDQVIEDMSNQIMILGHFNPYWITWIGNIMYYGFQDNLYGLYNYTIYSLLFVNLISEQKAESAYINNINGYFFTYKLFKKYYSIMNTEKFFKEHNMEWLRNPYSQDWININTLKPINKISEYRRYKAFIYFNSYKYYGKQLRGVILILSGYTGLIIQTYVYIVDKQFWKSQTVELNDLMNYYSNLDLEYQSKYGRS